KSTLINDIYLKLEGDPESADDNDDFSSVKSHNDLEVEQDLERTRERVEADLRRKEKVETPADDQSLPPLKYSSTPISRYQNFYTDQSPQTTEKLAPTNQQTVDTNPSRPTMAHPNPYETLYKCLRETGASREDAAAGSKAALALTKIACGASEFRANQQQQTIVLLAQVPAFNGMGSTKFEDWIQHFERVVDTTDFEEGRKIKLLG
ncbi:Uncharacterized protein APZ42_005836, partial [Daphnia magna]